MTDLPMFPRPKDIEHPADAVRQCSGGKEMCNLLIKAGRDEYENRKRKMWLRQGKMCCLYGFIETCPGELRWSDAVFAHEIPKGHGGGSRDDRIEIGGKRRNGAAHSACNIAQGSRRIDFNKAFNRSLA